MQRVAYITSGFLGGFRLRKITQIFCTENITWAKYYICYWINAYDMHVGTFKILYARTCWRNMRFFLITVYNLCTVILQANYHSFHINVLHKTFEVLRKINSIEYKSRKVSNRIIFFEHRFTLTDFTAINTKRKLSRRLYFNRFFSNWNTAIYQIQASQCDSDLGFCRFKRNLIWRNVISLYSSHPE